MTVPEQLVDPPATEPVGPVEELSAQAQPDRTRVVGWIGAAGTFGLLAAWLALRPSEPRGVAAVVDLLVLPAVLFAEARVVAGRPVISAAGFSVLFGLGAVLATISVLLLEGAADQVLAPAAVGPFGSVIEVLAPAVPMLVIAVLLLRARLQPTMADLAMAGLASGLGFLVVQTSIVTAAGHVAPDYVSPLIAGWQRMPIGEGIDPTYFVGPGVATAVIGLAVGASIRWRRRPWRLTPPLLAVGLLGLDRAIFDRQLRHVIAGEVPTSSGVIDFIRTSTFSGRLALPVLVLGLVLAGRGAGLRSVLRGRRSPSDVEDVDATSPAVNDQAPDPEADRAGLPPLDPSGSPRSEPSIIGLALALAVAAGAAVVFVTLARTGNLGWLRDRPVAVVVAMGGFSYSLLRLTALRAQTSPPGKPARPSGSPRRDQRQVPEVEDSQVHALTEGWTGLPIEGVQSAPRSEPGGSSPSDDGRQLLCIAAMAASAIGIVCAFLPVPDAPRQIHGALVLDGVRGWASHVGHMGFLLGVAGLAAPPGPLLPQSPGGWQEILPWRMRSSGWWQGLGPRTYRVGWSEFWRLGSGGGQVGRLGWSGFWRRRSSSSLGRGEGRSRSERIRWRGFWRVMTTPVGGGSGGDGRSGGRLPWRSGRWRPGPIPEEPEAAGPYITITIEPIEDTSRSRTQYEGATVQAAMQAALRDLGMGMAGTSLQLVDEGLPSKPGKPGSGRPARVRVTSGHDDVQPLLPPGRDSICRTTPVAVLVELVDPERSAPTAGVDPGPLTAVDAGQPTTLEVTLTNPSRHGESRTLVCHREEVAPGRVRYRSNPYSVDAGEDPTWFPGTATPTRGIKVRRGDQLKVEHADHEAVFTVHDTWAQQVISVNRALLDITGAHHVTALATREQTTDDVHDRRLEQLAACLEAVNEGRRHLASAAPDDEKAFLSTAILHQAMSLEPSPDDMVAAATAALRAHRNTVRDDPAQDVASAAYRRFLDSTVVGRIWAEGATTTEEIVGLLGWSRVSTRERGL